MVIHGPQEIIQIQLPDQKYPTLPFYILITYYVGFLYTWQKLSEEAQSSILFFFHQKLNPNFISEFMLRLVPSFHHLYSWEVPRCKTKKPVTGSKFNLLLKSTPKCC